MFRQCMRSIICACLLCCLQIGCEQGKVDLGTIDSLLFKEFDVVKVALSFPKDFKDLNSREISILRAAISNGTELSNLPDEAMPRDFKPEYFYILITKLNKNVVNLIYDRQTGYIFVRKMQVYYDQRVKFERGVSLFEKKLMGIYSFRPSPEIEGLLVK